MSGGRQSQETVIGAILVLGSLTASFFYGDWKGVAGMGIGLAGGAFGGATLILLIRMLQVSAGNQRPSSFGVGLVLLMAGAKIPV
ncbi:MAG TPA: hypothetical protein PLX06_13360, partial [Fimbriimonadaceae bacterium]|nr:hypothetical protein [Fimbriimonadaceae bacterium]